MNAQQIFDKVADHLAAQKRPSLTGPVKDAVCSYRGESNSRCAFGIFIPDDLYFNGMEGPSSNLFFQWALGDSLSQHSFWLETQARFDQRPEVNRIKLRAVLLDLVEHSELIRELQMVHDRSLKGLHETNEPAQSHFRDIWEYELARVARRYELLFVPAEFVRKFDDPDFKISEVL